MKQITFFLMVNILIKKRAPEMQIQKGWHDLCVSLVQIFLKLLDSFQEPVERKEMFPAFLPFQR